MKEKNQHENVDMPSIVILTGAGISAESGIKTFRDQNGLWENHPVEKVASPEGFLENPERVQAFYNARRAQLLSPEVKPNAAHYALAELEQNWPGAFLLVTQNVDNLHERAGSQSILHMHGDLLKVRCTSTLQVYDREAPIHADSKCECCNVPGTLRPHIVWFGEIPFFMDEIVKRLAECSIFLAIGTSGHVYPAAGFVDQVPEAAWKIEVNREESMVSDRFNDHRIGLASECVPELVRELLRKS